MSASRSRRCSSHPRALGYSPARPYPRRMIRIAITQAAFEAIALTLRLGSVGYENEVNERGVAACAMLNSLPNWLLCERRPKRR